MSGYFTRLLARAQAKGSVVRPQASLPFNTAPFSFSTSSPSTMDAASSDEADTSYLRTSAQPPKIYRQAPRENPPSHQASVVTSLDAFAPSAQRHSDHEAIEFGPLSDLSPDTASQESGGWMDNSFPLEGLHAMPPALDIPEVSTASVDPAAVKERNGAHNSDFRLMPDVERSASNSPSLHSRIANSAASLFSAQAAVRQGIQQQTASAEVSEVHVNIGRIEVTAVQAAKPEKRIQREQRRTMSLDEYLSRRQGGSI